MPLKLLNNLPLNFNPQTQWLLWIDEPSRFLTGDQNSASIIHNYSPLPVSKGLELPGVNLPIEEKLAAAVLRQPWHGFQFIEAQGNPGDLLRTLVFGPDYGLWVKHPPTDLILALKSGSIELLQRDGEKFNSIDKTKTRGKSALAFAGHPTQGLLAYGDNYGTFHVHTFDQTGFGKATKIATKERNATRVEFSPDGQQLLLGGMGYLTLLKFDGKKWIEQFQTELACKDVVWRSDRVFVNNGMHGIAVLRIGENGFEKLASEKLPGTVGQLAVSEDGSELAVTFQENGNVAVYSFH